MTREMALRAGRSTLSMAVTDSATMLRRRLRHMQRYPSLTLMMVGIPVILLLLFVYVFGGAMGAGITGGTGGRAEYTNYVVPAIIMMTVASVAQATAIAVSMDMTKGIIARFRTMAIARVSVLTGHLWSAVLQTLVPVAAVIGVALLVGFRPNATPVEWVATAGLLTLVALAISWLGVALGLVAKTVEGASNLPMPLILLPFLGSGFVPTDTMPAGVRWFAEYQPFTPIMETLRGLLLGTPIGSSAAQAVAWSVGIGVLSYIWAKRLYNRDPAS